MHGFAARIACPGVSCSGKKLGAGRRPVTRAGLTCAREARARYAIRRLFE